VCNSELQWQCVFSVVLRCLHFTLCALLLTLFKLLSGRLPCVAVRYNVLQCEFVVAAVLQCLLRIVVALFAVASLAICCGALQCVQCAAVCRSVLQCEVGVPVLLQSLAACHVVQCVPVCVGGGREGGGNCLETGVWVLEPKDGHHGCCFESVLAK